MSTGSSDSTPLHLIQLRLDAARLFRFAKRVGQRTHELDEGYAVHALLAGLFDHEVGEGERVAPKPFAVLTQRRDSKAIQVLGYTSLDHAGLRERAETFSDPEAYGAVDLGTLASRPMPRTFPQGTRFGFGVRVTPVERIAKCGPMTSDRAEVDAFLAAAWKQPDATLDREAVYASWLAKELAKEGAATLEHAQIVELQRGQLSRRRGLENGARPSHVIKRPDVRFEGTLRVNDSAAFATRLARGVGRHRSFGFGMLLLRPAPAQ